MSDLNRNQQHDCRLEDGTCKICHGEYCNKRRSFQRCKTCSSENDENCIDKPWTGADKTCPNYLDECYIHVKDGIVTRNCVGDDLMNSTEKCANSKHCSHCTGSMCNGKVLRPDTCLACDSLKNAACSSISKSEERLFSQACPISLDNHGCYHFIDKNNGNHLRGIALLFLFTLSLRSKCMIFLGCVNQLSAEKKKFYNQKTDEFKTCTGPKCNSKDFLEKCLVCNSTVDQGCSTTPMDSNSKVCDNYENSCFTWISKNNVIRGCLNDLDVTTQRQYMKDANRFEICSTSDDIGCNKNSIEMVSCIECDSTEDENCRLNPKETDRKLCAHIEPSRLKGCYLSIVSRIFHS